MIDLPLIKSYYTNTIAAGNIAFEKNILKEYIELMVLEHLSTTPYYQKLTFIGGTNLRLVKGINRFSEDLDFDIKNLTKEEFMAMTDGVAKYLRQNGLTVEIKDRDNPRLSAFRRSIYFPGLLYSLGLSGHKEERFLLKIEAQDQGVDYTSNFEDIRRNGFFFPIKTAPDDMLLAMKFSALLNRAKGRDFYDVMFLMGFGVKPDFNFLSEKVGIRNWGELRSALEEMLKGTDLRIKREDFKHLIFNSADADKIMRFPAFLESSGN